MNLRKFANLHLNMPIKLTIGLILVLFVVNMAIPQVGYAESMIVVSDREVILKSEPVDLITQRYLAFANLTVKRTYNVTASAYTSEVAQTDDSPCITANGYNVCRANRENVIAANFLPFGTKVRIPELYGDKIFFVQDRMNPRYNRRIDLWKKDKDVAKEFGLRYVTIEVLE